MDLTQTYPASVKTKIHGIVQLQRAIDKAKALAHGNVGDYNYDSPMDVAVFNFLGMDGKVLLEFIRNAKSDQDISDYVAPFIHKKSAQEIEAWNHDWLTKPEEPGSYAATLFAQLHSEVCPDRPDIVTFPDLIDYDEKRPVPLRAPVTL